MGDDKINKKYEILPDRTYVLKSTGENDPPLVLYGIRALRSFGEVKAGDLGGYVEGEHNLSHDGDCWLYENSKAFGKSSVSGNAYVAGDALILDNAKVHGRTRVFDRARICDNAEVYGLSHVFGEAEVSGDAKVYENAVVTGFADLRGTVHVHGDALLSDLIWSSGGITFSMSDVVRMVMNTPSAAIPLMGLGDSMDDFVKYVMSTPEKDDIIASIFDKGSP